MSANVFGNVVFSLLSNSLLTDSLNPPISSGPKTKKIKDKEGATFQDGKIHITASSSDLCKVNVTRFSREDFGVWNFSAEIAEKGEVISSEHTLDKIRVPCELIGGQRSSSWTPPPHPTNIWSPVSSSFESSRSSSSSVPTPAPMCYRPPMPTPISMCGQPWVDFKIGSVEYCFEWIGEKLTWEEAFHACQSQNVRNYILLRLTKPQ